MDSCFTKRGVLVVEDWEVSTELVYQKRKIIKSFHLFRLYISRSGRLYMLGMGRLGRDLVQREMIVVHLR